MTPIRVFEYFVAAGCGLFVAALLALALIIVAALVLGGARKRR